MFWILYRLEVFQLIHDVCSFFYLVWLCRLLICFLQTFDFLILLLVFLFESIVTYTNDVIIAMKHTLISLFSYKEVVEMSARKIPSQLLIGTSQLDRVLTNNFARPNIISFVFRVIIIVIINNFSIVVVLYMYEIFATGH